MVRRNELACRDEWSRSLWQPIVEHKLNGAVPHQRPPSANALLPVEPESLRELVGQDAASFGIPEGEDVLLSEARIVSEAHKPCEPSERPLATTNFDPRTAIFRAREAYRERARAKAVADRQLDGAAAVTAGKLGQLGQQGEPGELATGLQDQEAPGAGAGLDQAPEVDTVVAGFADGEHVKHNIESRIGAGRTEQRPKLPDRGKSDQFDGITTALETNSAPLPIGELPEVTEAAGDTRDDLMVASRLPAVGDEVLDHDPLPTWFRSDLPRVCRSCRDYRPAVDGQRGWCANAWAFTHHRMVQEDDLAPCQSSIGDWWTPVDDVWLVAADVASHGRATPLLDRLTGKLDVLRRRS